MRRMIAAALAVFLSLTLAACGKKEAGEDLLSQASGIPSDEVLLTVDGREVEAWRYLYWLAYTCDAIQTAYDDAGAELDWDADMEAGTLSDYAGEQAMADTVLYAVVESMADEWGCTLTEEDQAAMESDWATAAEGAGGEEAYLEQLAALGLNRDRAQTLAGTAYLYDQLRKIACDPNSAHYPDQDDLAAFSQESGYLTVDFIRIDAGDDPEGARAQAEEAFSKLNGSAAPENDFAVLAATYSDDPDREQYPQGRTLQTGDGTLPPEAEAAVLAVEEGQWSGSVEAEDSLYILLRRPLDSAAAVGAWFDWQLQSAAEDAVVEPASAFERLNIERFWKSVLDAQRPETAPKA